MTSLNNTLNLNRTLIVDIPEPTLSVSWRRHLERHQFGGVCLFRRNIGSLKQLERLILELREILGDQVLIGIDQEGGAVLRILEVPQVPAPMAIAAAFPADHSNPEAEDMAYRLGGIAGRGLRSVGINWNFAPTLDVNSNPLNPVIGERSFGSDPQQVATLGVAWARGLEAAGVMSSVKHFPGHGDTQVDSHLALPTVHKSLEELEALEWIPFQRAVAAQLGSVMTAHILYPALDPLRPATVSRAVLTELLRERWGYQGVIVTDSTDMAGVALLYPGGQAAALALIAGADAVLACTHGDMTAQILQVEAIAQAYAQGQLEHDQVLHSLERLSKAAQRFPSQVRPYLPAEHLQDQETIQKVARAAVTAWGQVRLPDPKQRIVLVVPSSASVGGPYEDFLSGAELIQTLQTVWPNMQAVIYPPHDPLSVLNDVQNALQDSSEPSSYAVFVTLSRWELSEPEKQLARLVLEGSLPSLHLALWNPHHAEQLQAPALITYGFREANLLALSAVLLGEVATKTASVPLEVTKNVDP